MTLDAPSAVAAAICHLSRESSPVAVSGRHPARCGWCDYAAADLARLVAEFDPNGPQAQSFRRLRPEVQRRLVAEAQAVES
jgi:hypothetical protein